jgi:hypothetical protein
LVNRRLPVTWEPSGGATAGVAAARLQKTVVDAPAVAVTATCVCSKAVVVVVPVYVTPPTVRLQPAVAVLALPVLSIWSEQLSNVGTAYVHVVTLAWTCAELVNDPKRPNTNPAMAMAAMSVIAIRITVASTGEMAFLFRPCRTIFICERVCSLLSS